MAVDEQSVLCGNLSTMLQTPRQAPGVPTFCLRRVVTPRRPRKLHQFAHKASKAAERLQEGSKHTQSHNVGSVQMAHTIVEFRPSKHTHTLHAVRGSS